MTGWLVTLGCLLSAAIWAMVGLYKITHSARMIEVIRARSIPFPAVALWLSVAVELGGAVLMAIQLQIWIAALAWIAFLIVATPIFHGRILVDGVIDYPQFVQVGKNLSILGGLLLVLAIDGTVPAWLGALPAGSQ